MDVEKARQLLTEIEDRQTELAKLCNGGAMVETNAEKKRKELSCSVCGSKEHTARTCPQKQQQPELLQT